MKIQKFIWSVILIAAFVIILTPFILFPVCDSLRPDGSRMSCWYSGIFIISMGILIEIFSFLAIKIKKTFLCSIFTIVFALMCWLVPNKIIDVEPLGLCSDLNHACRASTMPAVGILISLIILSCFVLLILNFLKGEK